MTTKLEEEIELLKKRLETIDKGIDKGSNITINAGEGSGQSSCVIKKTAKGEKTYEIKVYSNDLMGATAAVNTAINEARNLDAEVNGGST